MHGHMAPGIHPKVADAPPFYVIKIERVVRRPLCLVRRFNLRRVSGNGANGALLVREYLRQLVWSAACLYFHPP
jgi:hypothetical protein